MKTMPFTVRMRVGVEAGAREGEGGAVLYDHDH